MENKIPFGVESYLNGILGGQGLLNLINNDLGTIEYHPKKPFHLVGDRATYCDVDGTLIFTRSNLLDLGFSPADIERMQVIQIPAPHDGTLLERFVNQKNVELLIECKLSGAGTVLWSQAGHRWSAAVAEALGLNDYIDVTASKPTFLIDDLKAEDFMPKSAWKHPK